MGSRMFLVFETGPWPAGILRATSGSVEGREMWGSVSSAASSLPVVRPVKGGGKALLAVFRAPRAGLRVHDSFQAHGLEGRATLRC